MSTSTSTADSEVRAAFRAMLSAERAGYKLAVALVSTLVSYLVGTAELSDVSELDMSTLLTTAAEAWAATHEGEDLPNVHRSRLERWIANVPHCRRWKSTSTCPPATTKTRRCSSGGARSSPKQALLQTRHPKADKRH